MRKLLTEEEEGGRARYARAQLKLFIFLKRLQIAQNGYIQQKRCAEVWEI